MKKLILAGALAAVFASPALAQSYDPDVGSGNIAPPAYAQASETASHAHALAADDSLAAFARVDHGVVVPNGVVMPDGAVARDPDPNIQFQLNREAEEGEW